MRSEFFILANGSETQRSSATLSGTSGRQNGLLIDNARREFNKRHQGKYFVKEGKDWQQEIRSRSLKQLEE